MKKREKTEIKIKTRKVRKFKTQKEKLIKKRRMKVRMIPLTTYYVYYTWKWKTKCGNQKKKEKKEEKVSLLAFQFPGGAFVNCENCQLLKMAFGLRILVSILVVFLLLQTLNATSTSSGRRPLAWNKNHQIPPNCTHLMFKTQCSQNPQCRWCKS